MLYDSKISLNESRYTTKTIAPHTNLTEISQGLDLLWRNGIPPSKVVLGLGFYGRSFTLANPACNTPGCAFTSGGDPGSCTATSGILSNSEIRRIITKYSLTPTLDLKAGVKYMTWNNNQWVSYDDTDTFKLKMSYANSLCLAGTSKYLSSVLSSGYLLISTVVWALDLDPDASSALDLNTRANGASSLSRKALKSVQKQQSAQAALFWTPCLSDSDRVCPIGYSPLLQGHGKVFDMDLQATRNGCSGRQNRVLCVPKSLQLKNCDWNRQASGGVGSYCVTCVCLANTLQGKNCNGKCPSGTFLLSQNSQPAGDRASCRSGTYVAICCEDFTINTDICPADSFGALLGGQMPLPNTPDISWLEGNGDGFIGKRSVIDDNTTQSSPEHGLTKRANVIGSGGS